ncbi:MFS transporter [Mycolicibacterium sp. P9-22]|uniref:MFS transporter n=1 Tax=Mycolicibacterium sp. P9-22 TaxID=2024613 RepID=UPI0011EDE562|nr:MFS transporter [Mycolicibacterium sp. P9-22]KAA0108248.1 MFS transporter [Mycolicibacterium sp. P9-22]
MNAFSVMDDAPTSRFHKKLLIACCGGPFLDGYVLSIIGVALVGIKAELQPSSVEVGLIGAASLIGIFFGATLFGSLTDRIGREKMYALDLAVLVAACALSVFVAEAWQLIALRLLIGLAIGADYPIATSLLTEFTPTKKRGFMIGLTGVSWSVGAAFAYIVGAAVVGATGGHEQWRWLLGTSAVLGIIVLLLRRGIPESPRWLFNQGRVQEAQAVIKSVYGRDVDLSAQPVDEGSRESASFFGSFAAIVRGGYLKRTVMCGVLYLAQITPQYALLTFLPVILAGFAISDTGSAGLIIETVIIALFALGCIPALRWVETIGRRKMTIIPFAIMAVPLIVLWVTPEAPVWIIVAAFCLYAFASGGPSILEWIYPNELFPTEVRATAVGAAVGISRIGAATGTYLLPISIEKFGIGTTMGFGALLTLLGFVVCFAWAPETAGRSLEQTSTIGPRAKDVAKQSVPQQR